MIRVAASNSSDYQKGESDLVCSGSNDRAILQQAMGTDNERVVLCEGLYRADMGENGRDGNPYLYPGQNTTIEGEGTNTVLLAENGICRIMCKKPNVILDNLNLNGYIHIQNYESNQIFKHLNLRNKLSFRRWLDWRQKGGCTGHLQNWVEKGKTMSGIVIDSCTFEDSYHHGIGFHVSNAQEGGTWQDITISNVKMQSPGSGFEGGGKSDWSTGIDVDTGDIINMIVRQTMILDPWQSAFHTDGSWTGHRQTVKNLLFENCYAEGAGARAGAIPTEMYEAGFYVQSAVLKNCGTKDCRVGFLCGNEEANALSLTNCWDTGSLYGLVVEYGGSGAVVDHFVSTGARRRAVQIVGQGVKYLNVEVRDFKGTGAPVKTGTTQKVIYCDAPSHAKDLARYNAITYTVNGRFDFLCDKVYGGIREFIEVHPGSRMDMANVTLGKIAPSTPPEVVPPDPLPAAYLMYEDFAFTIYDPAGEKAGTWFVPDASRKYFRHGQKFVKQE